MKKSYTILCFLLMLFCLPQFSLASNEVRKTSLEQIIDDTTISINLKNAELGTILKKINKLTGVDYAYQMNQEIDSRVTYTLNVKDERLSDVLNNLFSTGDYTYEIYDEKILVTRKAVSAVSQAVAQQNVITVKGKIVNKAGEPIVGATILVTESNGHGAISGSDGNFMLSLATASSVEISCVGYKSVVIDVKSPANSLTVVLEEDDLSGGDVIVTGVFNKSRESYTGAVTTVTAEEIKAYKGQNLLYSLAYIDPGLNIAVDNATGSNPNSLPNVTIRGLSSLPSSLDEVGTDASIALNTPLVIVDGFEITLTQLMDYNTEEIESINILKDASSTSLYGSRGANGVIVVITKQPQAGKLRVSFNGGLNIEIPDLTSYDLMNASEKLEVERLAGIYSSTSLLEQIDLDAAYNEILANILSGVETDWISQPVRIGVGQTYNLRVEGGSDEFRWSGNAGYNNVTGAMKGSDRETINAALNFTYTRKNFVFKNQTSFSNTLADNGSYGSFSDYADMNPYWSIYDDEGYIIQTYEHVAETNQIGNPLYNATLNTISQSQSSTFSNNFSINWDVIDGLKVQGTLGLSKTFSTSDYFLPSSHTNYSGTTDITQKGYYSYGNTESSKVSSNLTINYNKKIDKHHIYVGVNGSLYQSNSEGISVAVTGFTNDNLSYLLTGLAYAGSSPGGSESEIRSVGLTANVNYTFDDRLFVDGSYRTDGSSQFGANNRFAPFWSLGAGWNLHRESFMRDLDFVNTLRLRVSTGESGSQQFSAYQAMQTLSYYTDQIYVAWNGAELMALGNEDLKWQTTATTNIGLEATLFSNRLNFGLDVYKKTTTDLLSTLSLQAASGFVNYVENVGSVENKGFELSLGGTLVRNLKKNLRWNVTAKLAHNKDVITELSDDIKEQTANALINNQEYSNMLFEGYSQNSVWAVTSIGIDPSTGEELYLDKNGDITNKWASSNKVYQGVSQPTFNGNLNSVLTYKNLTLNLSFGYYWGGVQYNSTLLNKVEVTVGSLSENVDKRVLYERWFEPGDVKYYKGIGDTSTKMSSRFIFDENVFSLQSASASYRLKLDNFYVNSVDLGINMSDIFYISSISRERGTSYPFARRISLTASLVF